MARVKAAKAKGRLTVTVLLALVGTGLIGYGLYGLCRAWMAPRPPRPGETALLLTTGYCNCEICCSWTTNAAGEAVYTYGRMKGRPKVVGRTCSGTTAHIGTIAADPKFFPFGTKLYVPGYGPGCVEDIGGAIKGAHLDLWFPTHAEAKRWGVRPLPVRRLDD